MVNFNLRNLVQFWSSANVDDINTKPSSGILDCNLLDSDSKRHCSEDDITDIHKVVSLPDGRQRDL